ncbi:MAG: hypothetical protein NUV91_00510 [Candidatus Omnitrophica bacterium]|nr:hypothetical protein [Candidatus Omnitrophota bacterium]
MTLQSRRNIIITIFVILWMFVFHYESLRYFYLEPLVDRPLPKMKFLFPPAGWIMFFNLGDQFGYPQVYGVKNAIPQPIDPHQVIWTRFVGFDNIHRGIMGAVLEESNQKSFCHFLKRKFPGFDDFFVTHVYYPSLVEDPYERWEEIVYQCKEWNAVHE